MADSQTVEVHPSTVPEPQVDFKVVTLIVGNGSSPSLFGREVQWALCV